MFKRLAIVLVLSLFMLHAQEEGDLQGFAPQIDFDTIPSAIVGNAVNVISGNCVLQEVDYVSRSANPIQVKRSYCSGIREEKFLGLPWDLNVWGTVAYYSQSGEKLSHPPVTDRGKAYVFNSAIGCSILSSEAQSKGGCNTAPPKFIGVASLLSKRLVKNSRKSSYPVLYNGVDKVCYGKACGRGYFLTDVTFGSGCLHHYSYGNSNCLSVNKIEALDKEGVPISQLSLSLCQRQSVLS